MTLETLLTRCYVKHWDTIFWFTGVTLQGNRLAVPDETYQRFITNCWGAVLREHIPELEIVVASVPQREKVVTQRKEKPSIYNRKGEAFMKAQQQRMDGME